MVHIYALTCTVTGDGYVGCTKGKTAKRMREHRCLLNAGNHTCGKLQTLWRRFGSEAFDMRELETLPQDATLEQKREAELRWMQVYSLSERLLNEHVVSFSPTPAAQAKGVVAAQLNPGNRWSAEANEKRRQAQLGKPKGHGAKISATKRAKREAMR
jgi:hypothetical protein